jgi:hypothetical protein
MLLMLALLSSAHAQSEATVPEPAPVQWAERTVLDEDEFRDLRVEGTLVGPGHAYIIIPPRADFHPMIRVRANFRPEMHKSVDEIR